jgi:hypothetical protein
VLLSLTQLCYHDLKANHLKNQKNQNSLFPSSAPAPSAAVVGFGGKSARRSKNARKGAKRSARRSAKRSSKRSAKRSSKRSAKRGMKGGSSSCMKLSGGKHRRSHSRSRGRGRGRGRR